MEKREAKEPLADIEIDYQNQRLKINTKLSEREIFLFKYSQEVTMKFMEDIPVMIENKAIEMEDVNNIPIQFFS